MFISIPYYGALVIITNFFVSTMHSKERAMHAFIIILNYVFIIDKLSLYCYG